MDREELAKTIPWLMRGRYFLVIRQWRRLLALMEPCVFRQTKGSRANARQGHYLALSVFLIVQCLPPCNPFLLGIRKVEILVSGRKKNSGCFLECYED
ncbi:hypothetical protein CDAR_222401 [Caerostris darwini]|uniref:Uncharacterized protein n=1 Tax=Caerostris darwini TaxID=1538125 RepID=A0AAV4SYB6_9ARAC|nr:hypothetical protein CDAR_222401 [Caerostris darwini]